MTSTHDQSQPLPALLDQVKYLTLEKLHRQLAEAGFDGIAYRHGHVFRFIDAEGARVTDLAERAGITKQAVGELVSELELMGYVARVADTVDRRAKNIRLTERGRGAQAASIRILADIEEGRSRQLGAEPLATLRRTLEDIVRLEHD